MIKKIVFVVLLLIVVFGASSVYWFTSSTQRPPKGIILISLDTLRADHLGIYGYHRETSPYIDAFARESIVFENAVVQSPWTLPSHMSIMTALYPSFHGVDEFSYRLADEHVTLAELLKEGGYQTGAFTDGVWMRAVTGINQGFEMYDDRGVHIANILPKVQKWLDANRSKPFFLFIHCYDIHVPYNPPPPYNNMFHDFTYTGNLAPNGKTFTAINKKKLSVTDEDVRHFIALYDGGIRYTDEKIGGFLTYLRDCGLYDQSLIIITSDHGEEFMEHDNVGHQQLYYKSNLHVPLIMRIPNYAKKEVRIDELIRSVDLLPTILDIAELPPHPQAQGRSFFPSIKREKNLLNQFFYRISPSSTQDPYISFAELKYFESHYWTAITGDGYKMISDLKADRIQLFNLEVDPCETTNIAADHNEISERLLVQWQDLYNSKPNHMPSAIDLDEQNRKQLEALGYVDLPQKSTSNETTDNDVDGIINDKDNCPLDANPNQEDGDNDKVGDVCDNCPGSANANQEDSDGDKIGDVCDHCTDTEFDGYGNPGFSNSCNEDNCPAIYNPLQEDTDEDGVGDLCDADDDNDGCKDAIDASPRISSQDRDGDGLGADCDNCPETANKDQGDADEDTLGNVCDPDSDNDGICDPGKSDQMCTGRDNCPAVPNPDQKDTYPPQGNSIGDVCDCEGDFNRDGSVNALDVKIFSKGFEHRTRLSNPCTNENPCNGDFDCDGDVDEVDRTLFQSDFGRGQYNNPCPDYERGTWCVYE